MITHTPFCFRRSLKQVIWGVTTATDLGNILDMLAQILCERAPSPPNQLDYRKSMGPVGPKPIGARNAREFFSVREKILFTPVTVYPAHMPATICII